MKQRPVIYLVDGSSYIYRAFHALPNLTNSHGEATGAILGVANMLRRLLQEHDPQYIAVVFDARGPTFRHETYPEYKANRPSMPRELSEQVDAILNFVKSLGLPLLQVEGVEADDVIGTLSRIAEEQGMDCVISTGDKDLAQLVTEHTSLVNTMTDTHMDQAGVEEKFGVRPEQIIDFLTLTGDTSDNIPGVSKCGPKTAVKWLQQYGTLDNLVSRADEVGGKIGECLRAALPILPLSRDLVTIRRELDLSIAPTELIRGEIDQPGLTQMLRKYEFSSWLKELDATDLAKHSAVELSYHTVLDLPALDNMLERLAAAELLSVDTETTSLDPMQARLVGLSFAVKAGEAWYVPVGHDGPGTPQQLDLQTVIEKVKPLLEDPQLPKVGQHIKYDMNVLSNYDIKVQGVAFDTMMESYVLNSTATRHDMDSLALKYLSRQTVHYEDVTGKGAKQICFSQVPLEQASYYAAEDVDVTIQLHQHLWPRLQEQKNLASVLLDIEIPLVPVLARMEQRGVLIDGDLLHRQSKEMAEQIHKLEKKAHSEAGLSTWLHLRSCRRSCLKTRACR